MNGYSVFFTIWLGIISYLCLYLWYLSTKIVDKTNDLYGRLNKKKKKQKNQFKIGLYYKVNDDTDNAKYISFKTYKDCAKWIEKIVTGSNTIKIVNLYNYDDYYKEG